MSKKIIKVYILKKIMQFFIIFFLLLSLSSQLFAKEVLGTLSEGEGSSFVPFQGSSFSIIRDVVHSVYDGNFNISIQSGGEIIYQENNQIDDLYLVFNDPINTGDEIRLYVNKGVFVFKMSSLETLPDVIVDAIKEQKPAQYEQMKQLHHPRKKPIVESQMIEPEPIVYPTVEPIVMPEPKYDSRVIKRAVKPYDYEKEQAKAKQKELPIAKVYKPEVVVPKKEIQVSKPKLPTEFSKPMKVETIEKPAIKRVGIEKLSQNMESVKTELNSKTNSQKPLDVKITSSGLEKVAKVSKITPPKVSSSGIETLPSAKTFPHVLDTSSAPIGKVSKLATETKKMESFSKTTAPMMQKAQTGRFKTQIATGVVTPPKFEQKAPEVVVKKIEIEDKIIPPTVMQKPTPPVIKPMPTPEIVRYSEPKVVAPPIEPELIRPEIVEKPVVRKMDKPKDRIVITKTIATKKEEESRVIKRHVQPQEYGREQEQIPERMSDRVVAGTGYGVAGSGKIKVKAYSNNRPVSAWVEVFKAGTKQRVKTFYTGKGRSLKDVKLPAGVYVIKATYRTAGSKRKKTVGRVTLDEGGSINKTITFDDGSLNVTVQKNGNPIYAKVEVFKAGKKRRIAYEFSSRETGVATLSLGSGTYDIVVRDHEDTRRFDSVSIKGGNGKSINVDF